MSDIANLSDTIVPKSDQLNAEQLLGGPITVTVTGVTRGNDDQPVIISYEGDNGRPYKPCKTCRKVLIFAWGDDGREWIGKSMTLYNNPDVKFGGVKVGGIRISHLSDIQADIAISLTATKGKKEQAIIKRLAQQPAQPAVSLDEHADALQEAANLGMTALQAAWKKTPANVRKAFNADGSCPSNLKAIAQRADADAASQEQDSPADESQSEGVF